VVVAANMTSVICLGQSHDSGDYQRLWSARHTAGYIHVYGGPAVLQYVASLETVTRSLITTIALLAVVMLLAGALGISGPAILTFSIWISILGLIVLGAFLINPSPEDLRWSRRHCRRRRRVASLFLA